MPQLDARLEETVQQLITNHDLVKRGSNISTQYGLSLLLETFSKTMLRQETRITNLTEQLAELNEKVATLETHSHYHYQGQEIA